MQILIDNINKLIEAPDHHNHAAVTNSTAPTLNDD